MVDEIYGGQIQLQTSFTSSSQTRNTIGIK